MDDHEAPSGIDLGRPSVARMSDYYLGDGHPAEAVEGVERVSGPTRPGRAGDPA